MVRRDKGTRWCCDSFGELVARGSDWQVVRRLSSCLRGTRLLEECHQLPAVWTCLYSGLTSGGLGPIISRCAGDCYDVLPRLYGKRADPTQPSPHRRRTRIIGGRREAEIAELIFQLAQKIAAFGNACTGSKGSSKPFSIVVLGMNCAIPWARSPLRLRGPIVSEWNRLSCQITRAKNSGGKS
jgi:hypothetical protein